MAIAELIMPKMGESIMEATILRWYKKVGDYVKQEETVLDIATDKVDSEVPSTATGIIKEILFNVNDVVAVGAVIARIEVAVLSNTSTPTVAPNTTYSSENIAPPIQEDKSYLSAPTHQESVPYIPQPASNKSTTSTNNRFFSPLVLNIANSEGLSLSELERISGTGADGRVSKKDILQYIADKKTGKIPSYTPPPVQAQPFYNPPPTTVKYSQQPTVQPVPNIPTSAPIAKPVEAVTESVNIQPQPIYIPPQPVVSQPVITTEQPLVQEISIPPSTPVNVDQPIVQTVVEKTIIPEVETRLEPVTIPTEPAKPSVEIIEMDRMRKLIAQHMVNSKHTSAHVTSFAEADVTNMVIWRDRIKTDFEQKAGTKITFTPMFIESLVKVLKRYPIINSSVEGDKIIIKHNLNIGMATALLNKNLIVPVIKHAEQLGLIGLAKSVNNLAEAARINKLKPEDTQGGTFTFTNVGTFGSLMGTPIINQPQVAILAVGAIKKRPVVIETDKGDFIGIRHMMYLSLSYDHRIIDGSVGASFITEVAKEFEKWDINRELKLVVKQQYVD